MKSIAAFAVILLSTPALAGQSVMSAESLLAQVRREGEQKVFWQLMEKPEEFDRTLSGIKTGGANWLQLAAELRGASDAAASLSLDYAIAQAIPHNPTGVLSLIHKGLPLDMICTSPFIEPDPGVAERYELRALAALRSVQGDLAPLAAQCALGVRLPEDSRHGP